MLYPLASSQRFARLMTSMTSRGSLPSKSGSEKGAVLPPPGVYAVITRLGAFLGDTLVADGGMTAPSRNHKMCQRQFTLAMCADFGFHHSDVMYWISSSFVAKQLSSWNEV